MDYEIPKRTLVLTFKGTEYDGAEVKVKLNAPVALYLELQGLADNPLQLYPTFGGPLLLEWNLKEDGKPLPVGAEGMLAIPPEFANIIINSWLKATTAVSAPLVGPSDDGDMSAEEKMRAEERSLSLGSSSGPIS